MIRLPILIAIVSLTSVLASPAIAHVTAQDSTPPAAMDVAQTQAVLEPYLDALVALEDVAPFFTDDVVLSLVEVDQHIQGRDAVAGAIDELHRKTFDGRPEIVNIVVGEGHAALEAVFVGTHTGEFAGIPATGREVAVPYTVFYDVSDGHISELRIYGFASGLVAQLTAEATPEAAPSA